MADYISINEHSNKGELLISRRVIEKITDEAVMRVLSNSTPQSKKVKIASPTMVSFLKDGKVNISVYIYLKKGAKADDICLSLQEEIAHDLATYTESLPFEIVISIADIK